MPIKKKWSRASPAHIKTHTPTRGGVYELRTFGELVYVGKASNLRRRLLEHLTERNPNYYRYQTAGLFKRPSSLENAHLTAYGCSKAETPPWNKRDPRG